MMHPPLTNVQAELLKVFSRQIPDEDLMELRQVMAKFLLQKSRQRADVIWQDKGYDNGLMNQLLSEDA
ncbi:hypothetical protein [Spirosoma rhododendri]|uniref:Uncharacterized protein n=1 Tax=Spirosoma rhododendri TaxID=2728024 RepID=A0A7L5DUH2_9BACT|nr:hypothetical protein [Spirosoma rhododendri]QJD81121.1 hypothetical protein HH216_23865 [Spirosoma rhododendri]